MRSRPAQPVTVTLHPAPTGGVRMEFGTAFEASLYLLSLCTLEELQTLKLSEIHKIQSGMTGRPITRKEG